MSAAAAVAISSGRTVLAFDFGERYLGVAVGDTGTKHAQPLQMIDASSNERRFAAIDGIVREWQPDTLVVGLPLALDGGEHAMSARARRFARQLSARFRIPVELADERFTSAEAEESLRRAGRGGRGNKHLVHALAAKAILQSYLDGPA